MFQDKEEAYQMLQACLNYLEAASEDLNPDEDFDESGILIVGNTANILWDCKEKCWKLEAL